MQNNNAAQLLVPAHVAQHYCDKAPFFPKLLFKKRQFSRSLNFWNYVTSKDENWFDSSGKDVNFAIIRVKEVQPVRDVKGLWDSRAVGCKVVTDRGARIDLVFMTTLCGVRTEDLQLLKRQLEYLFKNFDNSNALSDIYL